MTVLQSSSTLDSRLMKVKFSFLDRSDQFLRMTMNPNKAHKHFKIWEATAA